MSLLFDSAAAEKLIRNMNQYCEGIKSNIIDLMNISTVSIEWRDSQYKAFQANITDIAKDIQTAFNYENEYKKIFAGKIKELK